MKKIIMPLIIFAAAASGCATTPPFNCDSARQKIMEETEKADESADDYHSAEVQKDGAYYGVKAARVATCIGTLGLLCGVADTVASDNVDIEKNAKEAEARYKKSSDLVTAFRKGMQKHDCADIPQAQEDTAEQG